MDRDAMLAAIRENPACDTTRLAFADLLEETGEPGWAGFIRRQIANANVPIENRALVCPGFGPAPPYSKSLPELARVKPWERVRPDHSATLVGFTGGYLKRNYSLCVVWHRGFPAVIGCTQREWHKHHQLFPGPIEMLCFYGQHSGVWGTYPDDNGDWWLKSLVDISLPPVRSPSGAYPVLRPTLQAFPNVRSVSGACSSWSLHEFAFGRICGIQRTEETA